VDVDRLRYALETAGKSDRVVDTITDDLEQWLDDLWQRRQTPELSSLDNLRTRLTKGIKSSAAALDNESTSLLLLLVADDLDSLADDIAETAMRRGDVGLPSTTFRRHVLQMGLPLQHVMVGEIAD